jgi:hypothetical protein
MQIGLNAYKTKTNLQSLTRSILRERVPCGLLFGELCCATEYFVVALSQIPLFLQELHSFFQ